MKTGSSIQIFSLFWVKASSVDADLKLGQRPSDADLLAATWQQMYVNSNASTFTENTAELTQDQFGPKHKNQFTQKGFTRPSASPERPLSIGFAATHADLLKAGFGKLTAEGSSKVITEITSASSIKVTSSGFAAGDWIKIQTDNKTQYAKVATVTPGAADTIALLTDIETDTIVTTKAARRAAYWTVDDGFDTDEYFHLLLETSIGSFIMTWAKPAINFQTELNTLFKFTMNFMGQEIYVNDNVTSALIDAGAGSITAESQQVGVKSNYNYLLIEDADNSDIHTFTLDCTRTQVLKPGANDLNGFAGVYQDDIPMNLTLRTRDYEPFEALHESNDNFSIAAVRTDGKVIIDLPGCLVKSMEKFSEGDGQYIATININANAIMTLSPKFIFC